MPRQYTPDQIGVDFAGELKDFLDNARSGAFFCVHEYCNRYGEVATHYAQFGVNYGSIVAKSIKIVENWLTALDAQELPVGLGPVHVHYKTHIGPDGESNRASKARTPKLDAELHCQPNDERVKVALRKILAELTKPKEEKQKGADYQKEAKGLFSLDRADGRFLFYVRECLAVGKVVHVEGAYPDDEGFTTGEQALKNALKAKLPVGKYRQYKFGVNAEEGEGFTSLVIDGNAILVGDPLAGEVWATLPEWAKELVVNPSAAEIVGEGQFGRASGLVKSVLPSMAGVILFQR